MARLALIEREKKRKLLREKLAKKRSTLIKAIHDNTKTDQEKFLARVEMQKLPRNSSPVRARNRCALTGRPRGVFRMFGLSRNKLREIAMRGEIPGMVKASW